MVRCLEVSLTIPDNEARTALATLQRFGLPLAQLARADLYRCEVDAGAAERLVTTFAGLETIYNPNKHALRVRDDARPEPGEVWIDDLPAGAVSSASSVRVAGRTLAGVASLERFVAWQLHCPDGSPASSELLAAAAERLLCNGAFQRATYA